MYTIHACNIFDVCSDNAILNTGNYLIYLKPFNLILRFKIIDNTIVS